VRSKSTVCMGTTSKRDQLAFIASAWPHSAKLRDGGEKASSALGPYPQRKTERSEGCGSALEVPFLILILTRAIKYAAIGR
jgi:hypothetical protein